MLLADLTSWLTSLDGGVIKLLGLAFAIALPIGLWTWVAAWQRVRTSEHRAQIVQAMLQRGMSAEQIARVLLASQLAAGDDEENEEESTGDENADREIGLVKALTAASYEASDVQQILAAARVDGKIDSATAGIIEALAEGWAETESIVEVLESRRAHGPRIASPKSA